MQIFVLLLLSIIILFILFYIVNIKNKKLAYCIIIGLSLFFIASFRNVETGLKDTEYIYLPDFFRIQNHSFLSILQNFKDPFFYIFSKLVTFFSKNVRIWLAIISIPLIYAVTKLIYKESKNYMLSFIMFVSLNFYTLSIFTVLRHSMALAFTTLAYFQIKNKNFKKFLFYVVIATLFHQTAIIFIFAYWISQKKLFDKKYYIIFLTFIISLTARNVISELILKISEDGRYIYFYSHKTELSYMTFFISLFILITGDLFSSSDYRNSNEYILLSRLTTIGCCLTCFMPVMGEFNRLSMFYLIFEIILLPNCIITNKSSSKLTKTILIFAIVIVFSTYCLEFSLENAGLLNYQFFWR